MCTQVWVSIKRVLSTGVHSGVGKHNACTEYWCALMCAYHECAVCSVRVI